MATRKRQRTEPILDETTLKAVHEFFEFKARSDTHFDRWLHEQILRARKGRNLTAVERRQHLDF